MYNETTQINLLYVREKCYWGVGSFNGWSIVNSTEDATLDCSRYFYAEKIVFTIVRWVCLLQYFLALICVLSTSSKKIDFLRHKKRIFTHLSWMFTQQWPKNIINSHLRARAGKPQYTSNYYHWTYLSHHTESTFWQIFSTITCQWWVKLQKVNKKWTKLIKAGCRYSYLKDGWIHIAVMLLHVTGDHFTDNWANLAIMKVITKSYYTRLHTASQSLIRENRMHLHR